MSFRQAGTTDKDNATIEQATGASLLVFQIIKFCLCGISWPYFKGFVNGKIDTYLKRRQFSSIFWSLKFKIIKI